MSNVFDCFEANRQNLFVRWIHSRFTVEWPLLAAGAGAAIIEIDAPLLTVKLLVSMSGMERAFPIVLCR